MWLVLRCILVRVEGRDMYSLQIEPPPLQTYCNHSVVTSWKVWSNNLRVCCHNLWSWNNKRNMKTGTGKEGQAWLWLRMSTKSLHLLEAAAAFLSTVCRHEPHLIHCFELLPRFHNHALTGLRRFWQQFLVNRSWEIVFKNGKCQHWWSPDCVSAFGHMAL